MKYLITTAVLALALSAAAAAETRNLSGFHGVSAADRIRVEVTIGQGYRVEVTGSDADKVSTRIADDTLHIRRTNRPFWGGTPAIDALVRITMPSVDRLAASRGAELRASGISAQDMSLAASMGGEVSAAGTCTSLNAAVSMGGSISAEDLQCVNADIAASMGGEARVYASSRFDVAASMGGAVNVAGEGERGDIALSMGGTVSQN